MVRLLVSHGANIEIRSVYNRTPLHSAINFQHEDIACYLIDQGARVNVRDNLGSTALHDACEHRLYRVVRRMLESGAKAHVTNFFGDTPLIEALSLHGGCNKKYIDLFIAHGHHIFEKAHLPSIMRALCKKGDRENKKYLVLLSKLVKSMYSFAYSFSDLKKYKPSDLTYALLYLFYCHKLYHVDCVLMCDESMYKNVLQYAHDSGMKRFCEYARSVKAQRVNRFSEKNNMIDSCFSDIDIVCASHSCKK
jgi:hypothetical protein